MNQETLEALIAEAHDAYQSAEDARIASKYSLNEAMRAYEASKENAKRAKTIMDALIKAENSR